MINPIYTLLSTDKDISDKIMNNFIAIMEMMNNLESENCTANFIGASQIADNAITEPKWGIEQILYTAIASGAITAIEMNGQVIDYVNLDTGTYQIPIVKVLFYTGNGAASRILTHKDFRENGSITPQFMFVYPFGDTRNPSLTFRNVGSSKVLPPNTSDTSYIPGVSQGGVIIGSNHDVNAPDEQFACVVVACPNCAGGSGLTIVPSFP